MLEKQLKQIVVTEKKEPQADRVLISERLEGALRECVYP